MSVVPTKRVILVVDDHYLTRRVITFLLRKSGYDVRTAASGHAAKHVLSVLRPDAVLLDLALPGLSGIQVLNWLRQTPGLADVPVMIFSGDRDYVAAACDKYAEACLLKGSVCWNTLLDRLESLIGIAKSLAPRPSGSLMGAA